MAFWKFNFALIFVMVFFCQISLASAFLSPATISIVAASVGSAIWGILILVTANIILFFKQVNKKLLMFISIISLAIFIIFVAISINNFFEIRHLNEPYDNVQLLRGELDLNNIKVGALEKQYTILNIEAEFSGGLKLKEGISSIEFSQLVYLYNNFSLFEETFKLNKSKSYLVICDRGYSSSNTAEILNQHGYNVSFARLGRTYNQEFIEKYFEGKRVSSGLILVPYSDQSNKVVFDFNFLPMDKRYIQDTILLNPNNFSSSNLSGKNIICLTNFHCVLTKYALDSQGITVMKIYKIPLPYEEYMTFYQRDLII